MENVMNIEKVNKCCVDRVKELYNYAKNNDRIEKVVLFGTVLNKNIDDNDEYIDIAAAIKIKDFDSSETAFFEDDILDNTDNVVPYIVGAYNVNQNVLDRYMSTGVVIYDKS